MTLLIVSVGLMFGGWALTMVALGRTKKGLAAARKDGYRQGLKKAADLARVRAEIAYEVSPRGNLHVGAVRGQMAHAIELEILNELSA